MTLINAGEIPADLEPGTWCCWLDESTTWADFRVRMILPPRRHVPGDCLIQLTKEG